FNGTEAMIYAGVAGLNRAIGILSWGYTDGYRIPSDTGVALFTSTNPVNWNVSTRLDAVGFTGNEASYREGAGLPHLGTVTTSVDYAFVRRMRGFTAQDTDDNAADFQLVSVDGTPLNGVATTLGASGAEHSNAPVR